MEKVEEIPLDIIFEQNNGDGIQYRKNSIIINTRSEKSFVLVYKEAVEKMTKSIASKSEMHLEDLTTNVKTELSEEL